MAWNPYRAVLTVGDCRITSKIARYLKGEALALAVCAKPDASMHCLSTPLAERPKPLRIKLFAGSLKVAVFHRLDLGRAIQAVKHVQQGYG